MDARACKPGETHNWISFLAWPLRQRNAKVVRPLDSIAEATSLMLVVDGFTNSPAGFEFAQSTARISPDNGALFLRTADLLWNSREQTLSKPINAADVIATGRYGDKKFFRSAGETPKCPTINVSGS